MINENENTLPIGDSTDYMALEFSGETDSINKLSGWQEHMSELKRRLEDCGYSDVQFADGLKIYPQRDYSEWYANIGELARFKYGDLTVRVYCSDDFYFEYFDGERYIRLGDARDLENVGVYTDDMLNMYIRDEIIDTDGDNSSDICIEVYREPFDPLRDPAVYSYDSLCESFWTISEAWKTLCDGKSIDIMADDYIAELEYFNQSPESHQHETLAESEGEYGLEFESTPDLLDLSTFAEDHRDDDDVICGLFSPDMVEELTRRGNIVGDDIRTINSDTGKVHNLDIADFAGSGDLEFSRDDLDDESKDFIDEWLLRRFDRLCPNGIYVIVEARKLFETHPDCDERFIMGCLTGDWDPSMYPFDGYEPTPQALANHWDDVSEGTESVLEQMGFPKDVYRRLNYNEYDTPYAQALLDALTDATEDANMKALEWYAMKDCKEAVDETLDSLNDDDVGAEIRNDGESSGIVFHVSRQFVEDDIGDIWWHAAFNGYPEDMRTLEQTLHDCLAGAFSTAFEDAFQCPSDSWMGKRDPNYIDNFNAALTQILKDNPELSPLFRKKTEHQH